MAHASAVIWTKDLTSGTIRTNDLLTRIQICTKQGTERLEKTIKAYGRECKQHCFRDVDVLLEIWGT